MKLLKEVLSEIKPGVKLEKEVDLKINKFLKHLNQGLNGAVAILGGSGAKKTWLKGAHDADIFVCFDYEKFKDKNDKLSDILEKHLSLKFPNFARLHGSRDYFQIKDEGFIFEIVPILKIKKASDAVNITDVSPLHAAWVKKYLKMSDDIRLTKQFCKANNVYGAESYINGLSGYICEILTIYYGGFLKFVRAAAKWDNQRVVIDPSKFYKNKMEAVMGINKSKQVSPLIVIDPVQKERNAAAALSTEKYVKFMEACIDFIKQPSKDFFIKKEVTIESLREKAGENNLIALHAYAQEGKEDVIGVKLLKAYEFFRDSLIKNSFTVIECGWAWNKGEKALFFYIIDPEPLSEEIERVGPLIKDKKNVISFKNAHLKVFEKNKRMFALDVRRYRTSFQLIADLVNDLYLTDKISRIEIKN